MNCDKSEKCVSLVFCIDGTGSMRPFIEMVKGNIRTIISNYMEIMELRESTIDRLRVKVIVFRDYASEGRDAIQISPFYDIKENEADLSTFLSSIIADGGGDIPENGLEALYFAMKSDFTTNPRDRQVIILFSDAPALSLKIREGCEGYPSDMVDFKQLVDLWMCKSNDTSVKLINRLKRMTIVAPDGTLYEELVSCCNNSLLIPFMRKSPYFHMPIEELVTIMVRSSC